MKGTFTYLTCLMLLGINLVLQTGLLSFLIPTPIAALSEYSLLLAISLLAWAVPMWKQPLRHLMRSLKQIYPLDADGHKRHQKRLKIMPAYTGLPLLGRSFYKKTLLLSATWLLLLVVIAQRVEAQTYTLGTAPAINNATISTCSGTFEDSGGAGGNYGLNQDITVTFCSNTAQPITLSFDAFNIGVGDFMYVYNGPTTASPQFAGSPFSSGGFEFGPKVKTSSGTCITIRFTSNGSGSINDVGWLANIFCATATTITGCTGSFFDTGGAVGSTANLNSTITTICSDNGGQARVTFSAFSLDANYDFLYVYNGADRTAPQVAGSPFSAVSPGTITGTGTCLTFHYVSDASVTGTGWTSAISCVGGCSPATVTAIPTCAGATYNVSGTITTTVTTGTITVTDGVVSSVINLPQSSPIPYTLTGLTPGSGAHTVDAVFSAGTVCNGTIGYTAPVSCGPSAGYLLNSGTNNTTVTTCTGKFADSGNLAGNYGNTENNTISFCSGNTDQITLTFNNFNTEAGADLLYIYDGTNTSAPQVPGSPFSGVGQANSPGVVTSTGSCLTFRFQSNGSASNFGWDADISCSGEIGGVTGAAPGWNGYPGTACSPNTKIEGTVFEDFDNDGIKDALEPFIRDVTVTLYDENGQVGAATTTNVSGLYSFTALTAAKVYRVEFTVPAFFEEGAHGTGSGTAVQFVRAGTCSANLGLLDKGHYCGLANPYWVIPVYANGDPSHSSNAASAGVARMLYNASGQSPTASLTNYVTTSTIGTTWGTAYNRSNSTLYLASFLRRHAGLGPNGIGAIYKRTDAGTNTSATLFYDFGALAGVVANNATRFPGTGNTFGAVGGCGLCDNLDPTTFGQVGKTGLGDIDLNSDETVMYVTNLLDRKIYTINVNAPTPGSAVAIPNAPWLTGAPCTNGTARPWALKYRRGKLYVGVICDGGTSTCSKTGACSDLTATVYSYDGTTWATVISYPLNYYRKAYAAGSNYWVRWMDNWSDFTTNYANVTDANFAQPIFVDIEFDDDGSLIMGFGDRTANQTGYQSPPPPGPTSSTAERTFAHGDVLRAYFNPNTQAYTFENNGIAGPLTTTNTSTTSGPGGKSFYGGDFWYGAQNNAGIGSLGILPGSGEVMFPLADPIDPYASGLVWMSNVNGSSKRRLEIYQGSNTGNSPNFAKNGGLGDIELMCASPALELGNYVWWDNNLNGRMDPNEPGIPNVGMKLYRDPDGNTQGNNAANGDEILVATTTTDAYGRYIFSFSGASNGLNAQVWTGDTKVLPNTKYQIRINNFASDAGLSAFATSAGSPTFVMAPTQNQGVGGGTMRDNNAYNNPGNAAAAVLTAGSGDNDHNFDFGFGPGASCAVVVAATANTPCVGETLTLESNPAGGTAPFTYSWTGPGGFTSTNANPTRTSVTLAADGTYNVTVTDVNGCTGAISIVVQINQVTASAVGTDASCGMSNGSINVTVTGGITPYSYVWSPVLGNVEDPTGLSAGNYMVTVTESNGCTVATSAALSSSGGPVVSSTSVDPTCGLSNGTVTLMVSGGTSPYTFDWGHIAGASNSQNLTALAAGTYNVTVTDNVACSGVLMVTLTASGVTPNVLAVGTNASCGQMNGAVTLTVTGGSMPYTYDWDHVAGTSNPQNQTGLAAGTYTVTVTDNGSCTTTTSVVLTASPSPSLVTALTNPTCQLSNGSINLTVSSGTTPYTFDWNNDGTGDNDDTEDLSGLTAGTYSVTVTDANNCTATTAVNLGTSAPPTLTTSATNATSCVTNNGTINLAVAGGTLPYYYDWSNDGEPAPDFDTEDLGLLMEGTYTVTVTDGNGCTVTAVQTVGITSGAILSTIITDPANCAQTGSINLTITGGVTPLSIDWSNNGVGQTNDPEDLSGLPPGVYSVTVTDADGCIVVSNASILDIREPALSIDLVQPACGISNGAIDLEVVGGDGVGPYNYNWSNLIPSSDPQDQNSIGAGNYTVTVTDELQCSTVLTVNLSSSLAPELVVIVTAGTCSLNNGAIDLTVSGGTAPYVIDWDNIAGTGNPEDQMALGAGTYGVTATDAVGCTAVGTAQVEVIAAPTSICLGIDETDPGNNGEIDVNASEVGPFTYDWSDNTLDGQSNPTGLAAGTYTVTVTDAFGCDTDCQVTIVFRPSSTVAISDPCTCHDVVYDVNGDPLELLDYIDVTAPSGSTWQIIAHTGLETVDPNTNIPLPIPSTLTYIPALGVYRIHVAHTNGVGYSATVSDGTTSLSISNLCTKNIPQAPALASAYCGNAAAVPLPAAQPGFTTVYRVDNPAGTIITEFNPALYPGSSTVNIYARYTPVSASDCPMTLLIPVNILPLPAITTQSGNICSGQSINLATLVTGNIPAGTLTFYATQADATAETSALVNNTVAPLANTTYYVRSTTNSGCFATAPLTVLVSANPVPTVTAISTICAGATIDLNTLVSNADGGTVTFYSSYANAVAGTPTISSFVSPASATNYYVRSTNGNGCYGIKEITVTINAPVCGAITTTGPN